MLPSRLSFVLLLVLCSVLLAPLAFGQSVIDKTDYGRSQNTQQDIVNSLVPGKPNLTKGEKKQEVDPRTLQSKTVKDPTFEGGLNDVGLDWTGDKMGKPHSGNDADSKGPKKADAASEKDSKASKQTDASGDKAKTSKAADKVGDAQNKDQKAISDAKAKQSEKDQAGKSDGDR